MGTNDSRGATGPLRRATAVRTLLVGIVVGALAIGIVMLAQGRFTADPTKKRETPAGPATEIRASDFDTSAAGDCLTWGNDPTRLRKVACTEPHRLEVVGALAAPGTAPTSTSPSASQPATAPGKPSASARPAPYPSNATAERLRLSRCAPMVTQYLGKPLDNRGRFQATLLRPNRAAWAAGDRTLRCGIDVPDGTGKPLLFSGKVADAEQATVWPAGTCIGITATTGAPTAQVPCAQRHAFEVSGIVDLATKYPAAWPTIETQNSYLADTCYTITSTWFGAANGLRNSALQLQWSTVAQQSWTAGTRKVICFVAAPTANQQAFQPLTGSARTNALRINGQVPKPTIDSGPAGRRTPTPIPLPPGIAPNPVQEPAPEGG